MITLKGVPVLEDYRHSSMPVHDTRPPAQSYSMAIGGDGGGGGNWTEVWVRAGVLACLD